MSDLISRSELLERFCITKDGHRIPERDCDNFEVTVSIRDVKEIIKEQPTAYDIDKVVEELENNSFITVKNEEVKTKRKDIQSYISVEKEVVLLKDAIEIVKHGCVDDDVCKWKEIIGFDDMYIKNPHTNVLYINDTKRKNIYCNTCGKKIKVVE